MTPFYDDGCHTIYHGDWREVLPTLGPGIALVATDPPYGISYQSNKRVATPQFDALRGDSSVDASWIGPTSALLKDGGAAYIATRWDVYPTWLEETGRHLTVKGCVVWHKPGGGMGDLSGAHITDHEFIIHASKGVHTLRGKREGSVWVVKKDPPASYVHPTQKPVALMRRIIEKSSDPGDLVLDPFMGSGTTLRAAMDSGRRSIGIEAVEKYCEYAAARLQQMNLFTH